MKKIPVGDGQVALVDDEDYEVLSRFHWHHKHAHNDRIIVRTKWRETPTANGVQHQRSMASIITGHRGPVKFANGDRFDHRRANLTPKGPPLTKVLEGGTIAKLVAEREALDREINNLILRSS